MFYEGPPGLTVDLAQSSPSGVDVLYSHEYVAYRMQANLYVYAINNPLRYVDPSGLDWKECHLKFVNCKNKGKASEKTVCVFRCRCPDDPGGEWTDPAAIEFRGCQSPRELDEIECLKYLKETIKGGDCCKRGGTPPSNKKA